MKTKQVGLLSMALIALAMLITGGSLLLGGGQTGVKPVPILPGVNTGEPREPPTPDQALRATMQRLTPELGTLRTPPTAVPDRMRMDRFGFSPRPAAGEVVSGSGY